MKSIILQNLCCQYSINYSIGEVVVGSCLCLIYDNHRAKVMQVDEVDVKESYRSLGYGKELMAKVVQFAQAQQVDSIELVVNEENEVARGLYRKLGFTETAKKHCRRLL